MVEKCIMYILYLYNIYITLSPHAAGYLPVLALIALCFVGCDRTLAIVVLCIAVGTCGAIFAGYMCSHVDLAPRYAGTLMGLTNTFATIPGFAAPAVAGAITQGNVSWPK